MTFFASSCGLLYARAREFRCIGGDFNVRCGTNWPVLVLAMVIAQSAAQGQATGAPPDTTEHAAAPDEGTGRRKVVPNSWNLRELPPTEVLISWRDREIERLSAIIQEKDYGAFGRKSHAAKLLVRLRAIEAVPVLCDEITYVGYGFTSFTTLPMAGALQRLGESALPGIYRSFEEVTKTAEEIKIFAFVIYAIDDGDAEFSIVRLNRQIAKRVEESKRNATFNENARKLLQCFATPRFFEFENSPFYPR